MSYKRYSIRNISIELKMSDHICVDFLLEDFKNLIYSKVAGEFQIKIPKINLNTIEINITNFYVKMTNPLEVKPKITYFSKNVSSLVSHVDNNKVIGCCYSALYELQADPKYKKSKLN